MSAPQEQGSVVLRLARPDDLPAIARVHAAAFVGFFMTRLGPAFLREYYRTTLDGPGGILLVAEQDGAVTGFVAGFVDPEGFYAFMRTRKVRLGLSALGRVLLQPNLIPRLMLNFSRVRSGKTLGKPYPGVIAELSSIGVDPQGSGKGVGRQLVADFLRQAAKGGAQAVTLSTDAHDNERTNTFYQKLGFQLLETFTQADGRVMHTYGCQLDPQGVIMPASV